MKYEPTPITPDEILLKQATKDVHELLLLLETLDLEKLRPEWVHRLYEIRRRWDVSY